MYVVASVYAGAHARLCVYVECQFQEFFQVSSALFCEIGSLTDLELAS